ncbi:MAG TPA: hypothetical protein PKD27_09785 [Tepidiformaceae bacterium]|nr:hypothetical protein [Tepidiformaceae bacterium]
MARTTLNLDPGVLAELKRRARKRQKSLGEVASEQLAKSFRDEREAISWPPPGWTADMGESAVPLEDREALQEFFDREDGSFR